MTFRTVALPLLLLMPLLMLGSVVPASAQDPADVTVFSANAIRIALGGRVQTLFSTTSVDDEADALFEFRRVRMDFTVRINDYVSGKVQPELAGDRISLRDTYLLLTLDPALEVIAGKTFRPFSLLAQTSSARMPLVERGVRIRGVQGMEQYDLLADLEYADRAIGLQIRGAPTASIVGLEYGIGVFNGPTAPGIDNRSASQIAARLSIEPVPGIRVGGGWSSREFRDDGPTDDFRYERGNAWEIDAEYGSFAPGLHLLGEVSFGDYDPTTGEDFSGAQLWSAYRVSSGSEMLEFVEPAFRASYGSVGDSDLGGTLLTPGINLYFDRLNRIMVNLDFWQPEGGGDTVTSFKTMFQLAF